MLNSESKKALSETIRTLRARLIEELRNEAAARYRLSVPADVAQLSEAARARRERLDHWLDERTRALGVKPDAYVRWSDSDDLLQPKTPWRKARLRFLDEAASLAAATFLNRLVVLRCMEAAGVVDPPVLTGGLSSKAVKELRDFAPYLFADENAGYAWLLAQVFEELALDLPGLFGDVGLVGLFEASAGTLRTTVDALEARELADVWDDDTTLGWTYQYWNDPQREALDDRLSRKGRVAPFELACKTQLFTERYMVEWLLANTLGRLWLAMCRKNGWQPHAVAMLDTLNTWRSAPQEQSLPPELASSFWRFYAPRELTASEVASAPSSLRDVRLLDPACGSGHFLVLALDTILSLYREEAELRGERWSDDDIVTWALGENLHGIDIDPRAVEIAAAGLYLRARKFSRGARIPPLALVAPAFDLSGLNPDDEALQRLTQALEQDAGIPREVTLQCVRALDGVAHMGSLLRLKTSIREALRLLASDGGQRDLFSPRRPALASEADLYATFVVRLEEFLARHTRSDDLGLRGDGAQLAAGVRLARILREGAFDLVVGNPPYLSSSKMIDSSYVKKNYPEGQSDLFGAFFLRGMELLRPGGYLGFVTLANWLSLGSFRDLRARLLSRELVAVADLGKGAFSQASALITTAMAVLRQSEPDPGAVAIRVPSGDAGAAIERAAMALATAAPHFVFNPTALAAIEGSPVLFWLDPAFLARYATLPKVRDRAQLRPGMATYDNDRYLRMPWEVAVGSSEARPDRTYVPYIKGAKGRVWFDSLSALLRWRSRGLELRIAAEQRSGAVMSLQEPQGLGIAYTTIGNVFGARLHRVPGVLDVSGASAYSPPEERAALVCALNRTETRRFIEALNPTVNFQLSDVARAPVVAVPEAATVIDTILPVFEAAERARESAVDFSAPGVTQWAYAQRWAQSAVDRTATEPLPPWNPEGDPLDPVAEVSFALGVALGRFGARGEGWLSEAPDTALPGGILFLSSANERDGLAHPSTAQLRETWARVGATVAPEEPLRAWLQRRFFEPHRRSYENSPIFLPLSSEKKSFVAWVSIHRWRRDTLQVLLAEHLLPERRSLEGRITDLRQTRATEGRQRNAGERQLAELTRYLDELNAFIDRVQGCAEQGPPPADARCPARERDAPYAMDLDDGVMMNASALWPLLQPQWTDPRAWWKALCLSDGKKDYDWSPVAARYFPRRVEEKCRVDRSLAVVHRCLWRLHPATAYTWELRLRDEGVADTTFGEPEAPAHRERFFAEQSDEARRIREEHARRAARRGAQESPLLVEEPSDELDEDL